MFPWGPLGARTGPVGCQAPAPSQPKSLDPGDPGAGAAGAAGLLVAGAGGGIPGLRSQARRWAGPRASSANARPRKGGNPVSTPSLPSPTPVAPLRSCCACQGHGPDTTWVFIRRNSAQPRAAPREPGFPSTTHGTPLVSPREVGDRLAPGPRKVSAFRLPKLRAICPPQRFPKRDWLSVLLGIQPFSLGREGFPHLGSSCPVLFPSRSLPPPPPLGPEAGDERTFPGRVSLPRGNSVCPACLIPLRCIEYCPSVRR